MKEETIWKIVMAGSGVGLLMLFFTWTRAESAPQEAAGAAIAAACAVIPYCFARAFAEINSKKDKN